MTEQIVIQDEPQVLPSLKSRIWNATLGRLVNPIIRSAIENEENNYRNMRTPAEHILPMPEHMFETYYENTGAGFFDLKAILRVHTALAMGDSAANQRNRHEIQRASLFERYILESDDLDPRKWRRDLLKLDSNRWDLDLVKALPGIPSEAALENRDQMLASDETASILLEGIQLDSAKDETEKLKRWLKLAFFLGYNSESDLGAGLTIGGIQVDNDFIEAANSDTEFSCVVDLLSQALPGESLDQQRRDIANKLFASYSAA